MLRAGGRVKDSYRGVLESAEFRDLVVRRWRVSLVLTALLFLLYYGYIILIATNRALLSHRVGTATTTGILLAAAVIIGAWVLTPVYVGGAHRKYDLDVARLASRVRHD